MLIREAILADLPALVRVQVDAWRTTYKEILPSEFLANLSYEQREQRWREILSQSDYFIYVAENPSGQIVGFASGGVERSNHPFYQGELTAIYILKDYQHQGVGTALVKQVVDRLTQMGLHSILVWVLQENPACQFYERLGGQNVQKKEITIANVPLIEIAYGWENAAMLKEIIG